MPTPLGFNGDAGVRAVLSLQRMVGNRAVAGMVQRSRTRRLKAGPGERGVWSRQLGSGLAVDRQPLPVQRDIGDVRNQSLNPAQLEGLADDELQQQIRALRDHISGLDRNDPTYQAAMENHRLIEAEAARRNDLASGAEPVEGSEGGNQRVPRPPGLPLDQGYTLIPLGEVPGELLAQIPEGTLTTLTPEILQAAAPDAGVGGPSEGGATTGSTRDPVASPGARVTPGSDPGASNALPTVLGAGGLGLETSTAAFGLNPAGRYAIGYASFPRVGAGGRMLTGASGILPQHPVPWGHTAMYVRQAGRITKIISFAPENLMAAGLNIGTTPAAGLAPGTAPSVRAGTGSTPGAFYSDRPLLLNTKVTTTEFAVPPEMAEAARAGMPEGGPWGRGQPSGGLRYTAVPSAYGNAPGSCPNCVSWAVPRVGEAVGGPGAQVTNQARVPVTDLTPRGQPGTPGTGNQQALINASQQAASGRGAVNAGETPGTVGRLSPGMQVLKWGGRVMLVVSAYTTYAEIRDAPEGEQGRTAAGALGGFGTGLAAGAAAGLACGPGALVCSAVLGLTFGTIGYFAGREAGELAYDTATGVHRPRYLERTFGGIGGGDGGAPARWGCPGQASCHMPAGYQRDQEVQPIMGVGLMRELSAEDKEQLFDLVRSRSPGAPGAAPTTQGSRVP